MPDPDLSARMAEIGRKRAEFMHHIDWCNGYCSAKGDQEGRLLCTLMAEMEVLELAALYHGRCEMHDREDNTATPLSFWLAVEQTRFAGWGGRYETDITGYQRPTGA